MAEPNTDWTDPIGLLKPSAPTTGWTDSLGILKPRPAVDSHTQFMADATASKKTVEDDLAYALAHGASLMGRRKAEEPVAAVPKESRGAFEELRAEAGPRGFTFAGRVVKPGEKIEDVLKRTPTAELEAGGRMATGAADLAAAAALSKLAVGAAAAPKQTAETVTKFVKEIPEKWRDMWQNIGENITSKVPTYFRAGRGTPLEFREARFQMEADIANRMEQAVALGTNLKKDLTIGERLRADQLLRGGITTAKTDPKLIAAVEPVRGAIDEIQEELIKLGRLSPETVERFQENFGPYLARLYSSKEFTKNPVFPFPQPVRAGTERLLTRGDRLEVNLPKSVKNPDDASQRVQALESYLNKGYIVEKRDGRKVTLFRDIPETVRKEMGEIRSDPGYVAGKSIAQAGREVAITKFFKTVADNPEWADDAMRAGWAQMPTDKKRLGDLAGKWVRPDIASEINDAIRMKADWEKILARTTQLWKIGKVTNPATIARNFYSSGLLADWGGLSPYKPSGVRSYATTVAGFRGKDPAATHLIDEARAAGLFKAGYNEAELNALATGYVASKESNPVLRLLDGLKGAVDKTKVGQIYGSVDQFYKGALYVHGRKELGMDAANAARYARKYGIDYSDISPFVKFMRDIPLGSPFITFASKALPLAIETAVKNPVRFWKWPAIIYGANELSKATFGTERDEVEKLGDLAKLRTPRYVTLPGKSADGRNAFLDLGYILPFGDLIEAYDKYRGGAGDANISFEPLGGPLQPFVELAFNKSLFTKQPIYNATDTFLEKSAKISDYLGKALLPSWTPPVPGTGFRGGYTTEAFRKAIEPSAQIIGEAPIPAADYFGRTRTLGAVMASKLLGIDVKNISMQDVQRAGVMELQRTLDELGKQTARIAMMAITPEQKQQELLSLTEKYKALEAEVRKKLGLEERQPNERKVESGWNDSLGILK